MVAGASAPGVRVAPFFLTRDEWHREMHARLDGAASLLTSLERHVCVLAAARQAQTHDAGGGRRPHSSSVPA